MGNFSKKLVKSNFEKLDNQQPQIVGSNAIRKSIFKMHDYQIFTIENYPLIYV